MVLDEVKWGIIGCGNVTEVKSGPPLQLTPHSSLVAVMRRDPKLAENYAKRHQVPRWYSHADELINDPEVNAIYIATPPDTHLEYAIKAMQAGKPVYIEKPMGRTYAECKEMLSLSDETGLPINVAYYRRALPGFLKVKELVETDAIGSVRLVNVRFYRPMKDDLISDEIPWRLRPEIAGGGLLFDLASHTLDFLDYSQTGEPAVHINLDGRGATIFQQVTRESIGKRMAMILVEKGKGEVITAPVIRSEIPGGRVQISGRMTTNEARDVALLLRAGALAAPMEIVEERTVGPSLGADNISRGFHSTMYGFGAIAVFMIVYYMFFGVISVLALAVNLMLLVALLSMLQATLTLPGLAAIALTLGMAIDSNVLINERIREELRNGTTPQAAIAAGYERAWATILDSNITTLIAGIALFMFGSGPVRGFAVVHCLGILTSMFSAVLVSRGMVNLVFGARRKLDKLPIGNTDWYSPRKPA